MEHGTSETSNTDAFEQLGDTSTTGCNKTKAYLNLNSILSFQLHIPRTSFDRMLVLQRKFPHNFLVVDVERSLWGYNVCGGRVLVPED